jgi:hypothetical protein
MIVLPNKQSKIFGMWNDDELYLETFAMNNGWTGFIILLF